jgi:glycosyltransferase involved in cell wall biosynthesis
MIVLHIAEAGKGVDRYLRYLLPLMKDNIQNFLLCSQKYDVRKYQGLVEEAIQMEMGRMMTPVHLYKTLRQIRKIIKEIAPDIVYCHSSFGGGLGRIAALGIKTKVVYNPHGWAFNIPYGIKPKVYKLLEKILACFTDRIIAISDFEKRNAIRNHVANNEKIEVIYSGIDLDETVKKSYDDNITRESLHIPNDAFVVGMTARICETKSPDVFVKAAKIIKNKIPNAYFIMIGDGEQRKDIETLITKVGIKDCTIITGWVDNPLPYVRLLDVGLLLSRWEGFGFALTEYMKLEKPIVATNVCAIPDLIKNGVNGLLVGMDDYKAVADSVVRLYHDSDLRKTLILNGKHEVNCKYDISRVAKQHIILFEKLLS